jgi:hypothetical protein
MQLSKEASMTHEFHADRRPAAHDVHVPARTMTDALFRSWQIAMSDYRRHQRSELGLDLGSPFVKRT